MANFLLATPYGINDSMFDYVQGFSLQFHITAKCDQSCKHCYMYNSPNYKPQIENPLTKEQALALIDEYFSFLEEFQCTGGYIAVTGGDPILSPNFWDILEHIRSFPMECKVIVLGNPFHIFEEEARRMFHLGVKAYQISLDGLRETHDYVRKPGSFDESLRALRVLHQAGIEAAVAFTVSKLNAREFLPLYRFLRGLDYVDSFGFDRMVPTGNGEHIAKEVFTPQEYRQFLFDVIREEVLCGEELAVQKHDQMWRPMLFDLGLVDPACTNPENRFRSGCACGTGTTSILADGKIFPCRKLDIASGKYPEASFRDLFINCPLTRHFRNHEQFSGCGTCEVNAICRGCPSMKYAVNGKFYANDPNCWKVNHER